MVSVLIIAELAMGHRCSRNLKSNFCHSRDLNPEPLDWQFNTLTTRPPEKVQMPHPQVFLHALTVSPLLPVFPMASWYLFDQLPCLLSFANSQHSRALYDYLLPRFGS